MPTCSDCKFFDAAESEDGDFGACRRHAPTVVRAGQLAVIWDAPMTVLWPRVHPERDWCGEYCDAEA